MTTSHAGTGGSLLVEILARQGIRHIYGVPGESFIAVLDALFGRTDIRYVTARHEGGASFMAEAEANLTGGPGVLLLARGPGSANAMAGLHVAWQDSTPLLVLVGLPPTSEHGREGFQEIDVPAYFAGTTKWADTVRDAARLPELLCRALHTALGGRPGPVALGLPEDVLSADVSIPVLPGPVARPVAAPAPDDLDRTVDLLTRAQRPLIIAGSPTWSESARTLLEAIAAAARIPVATAFRRQDHVATTAPVYAGHMGIGMDPALAQRVRDADVILALGPRLGETTTKGYTLLRSPRPAQTLIHVHPDPAELGRVFQPSVAIPADAEVTLKALPATLPAPKVDRAGWLNDAAMAARRWAEPRANPGPVQMAQVIRHLGATVPEDAIVASGAGNYTGWVHRYYPFRRYGTQLAPTSGSMGYGLPAAIGAALAHPGRTVIAVAGDGCLQMHIQELATAAEHGLRIVVLLIDNGILGSIRMHQEVSYPDRVVATTMGNPDFTSVAQAFGLAAFRVDITEAFPDALAGALAADGPGLIHIRIPPEALTTGASLSELRGTSRRQPGQR